LQKNLVPTISAATYAEIAQAPDRPHGFSAGVIKTCLEDLLESSDVYLEGRQTIGEALGGDNPFQFADFLIAGPGMHAGCSSTMTFDRRSAEPVPGMELFS